MKHLLSIFIAIIIFQSVHAQITIASGDMPVSGDTLRYSFASPLGTTINPGDSGANVIWNYSLTPTMQAVDSYQGAFAVNPLYLFTVGATAFGYKVADSFPIPGGILPISIQQVYTFFETKTSPSRYEAKAFAASVSGVPTAINYTTPDVWYFFPLNYLDQDSSSFKLNITVPTLGAIKQSGYRITRVDGWGTITTPYYTTPVNCIRVRSEVHQVDSIPLGPISFGFPLTTVEYKWLVSGDHYPALWVTSNLSILGETITGIKYRDSWRYLDTATVNKVSSISPSIVELKAYPNPAADGLITFDIPAPWQTFSIEIFDMQMKNVASFYSQREINITSLAAGTYVARVISGNNTGYVKIVR